MIPAVSVLLIVLVILAVIAVGNLIVLGFLLHGAARNRREREAELTRRAAEQAIERGLERVRGREWVRAHRR